MVACFLETIKGNMFTGSLLVKQSYLPFSVKYKHKDMRHMLILFSVTLALCQLSVLSFVFLFVSVLVSRLCLIMPKSTTTTPTFWRTPAGTRRPFTTTPLPSGMTTSYSSLTILIKLIVSHRACCWSCFLYGTVCAWICSYCILSQISGLALKLKTDRSLLPLWFRPPVSVLVHVLQRTYFRCCKSFSFYWNVKFFKLKLLTRGWLKKSGLK